MARISVRARRLLILPAALVIVGALVVPVVLTNSSSSKPTSRCTTSLRYKQNPYERRSSGGMSVTQSIATGVGVLSGCGQPPTNVSVRSLIGINPARAVVIGGDPNLYVRAGVCGAVSGARLVRCLRTSE